MDSANRCLCSVQVSPTVYDRDALAAYMASPERLEAVNDQMAVIKTALAAAALEVLDALVDKMEASAKTERVEWAGGKTPAGDKTR
jgi:hypothetical protein